MFNNTISQTQLSNILAFAGVIVLVANQFGFVLEQNQIAFGIAAVWSIGWQVYNYWQRFQKGDVNVFGGRK